MPNVLSARHLVRIAGGRLYATTSNLPWATLLASTFDVDVKSCAHCGGRLDVRAVVTDKGVASRASTPPSPLVGVRADDRERRVSAPFDRLLCSIADA